jgi:hypothetical protein
MAVGLMDTGMRMLTLGCESFYVYIRECVIDLARLIVNRGSCEGESPTYIAISIFLPFVRSNPIKREDARGFEFRVSGSGARDRITCPLFGQLTSERLCTRRKRRPVSTA